MKKKAHATYLSITALCLSIILTLFTPVKSSGFFLQSFPDFPQGAPDLRGVFPGFIEELLEGNIFDDLIKIWEDLDHYTDSTCLSEPKMILSIDTGSQKEDTIELWEESVETSDHFVKA